ncbi:hypothetical protein DL240_03675 [Lujinxingia litoralis]|uniref:tRNA(Ile)-lysidine/2-thiocytidine synthase N-terminal domain-containing protein n=1 Tax=Lujinxingia litoralis TaxID=2211119 RepID=A0A328CAX1_9DELT|nr:ATP-binding protein [Lujinxingia litoralis]RAL25322.1 hypothetical protein DL240_03675 [Lujinxingia litoralis]
MSAAPLSSVERPPVSRPVMKLVERALRDFELVVPGDHVAVGISGGKDSLLLAAAMLEIAARDDFDIQVTLIHLDQNQPGFDRQGLQQAMTRLGVALEIIDRDTHSVVQSMLKPGQIPCAICGRMRRGILNAHCAERGYTKLAMGHHLDDAVETYFLNLLFGSRLDPLKPATPAETHPVTTIRPLILVEERKIEAWVEEVGLAPVACPVCDTFPDSSRRDVKTFWQGFSELAHRDVYASVREALYGSSGPFGGGGNHS